MTSIVSIVAYHAIPNLEERQARVRSCIAAHPDVTSNEVASIANMEVQNVRSRITELLNDGSVIVTGNKMDGHTGRRVRTYSVKEARA